MDKLLDLYQEFLDNGVSLFTWDIGAEKAATLEVNGQYAVFVDFDNIATRAEEAVVVAHEGGHCATGATHRVYSPFDLVEKHENKAWKWAVKRLISADDLDDAVASGCTELWQLADHFGVTEDLVRKAVCLYTYGNLAADLYF